MLKGKLLSRIDQLLEAAAKVFISRGYKRAAMSDIAREMGVAPGTIYLYVESKEALFHLLVMRTAIGSDLDVPDLPVRTPAPGATLEMLRQVLTLENYAPKLAAALRNPQDGQAFADVPAIITELYDNAYARRTGIDLIERSAIDWPEMAEVFYEGLRAPLVKALSVYLQRGIAAGKLRPVTSVRVAARFIVETIAWFAIHRHGDPRPKDFPDDEARAGVIALLTETVL
jgi:AcrR family transcriptional regulator